MSTSQLLLYSREGCCLCKGLEQRLSKLDLSRLNPPLQLYVVDIDAPSTPAKVKYLYDLRVPVLAIDNNGIFSELPPVPPRLIGEQLKFWLQRSCTVAFGLRLN